MAEWPKATVSKIVVGETSPRVRIPLSPPFFCLDFKAKNMKPEKALLHTPKGVLHPIRTSLFR